MRILKPQIYVIALLCLLIAGLWPAHAATHKTAKSAATHKSTISRYPYLGAIVVDGANGRVLFEDQPDSKGYPACVLKLMDLLIILEKIEQKQLSLQDQVP